MKNLIVCSILVCILNVNALNPGPFVYVVTPSTQKLSANEGRSAPFYYRNWMRRMDSGPNSTSTSTTTPSINTPDLIFAEFESESDNNMRKSIRKLLEKERVQPKTSTTSTTTTSGPIYVLEDEKTVHDGQEDDIHNFEDKEVKYQSGSEITDYYTMYNNLYNNVPAPVYLPSTTQSTTTRTTTSTPPQTTPVPVKVENIWHIIDNEKQDNYIGKWNEVSLDSNNDGSTISDMSDNNNEKFDENFSIPGFGKNPGNGAENESRAIRTEQNIRFPYVSLKPFQMKKSLLNTMPNSKKGNNMFTNLDNFQELKNPVRGEAQDVVSMMQPIDRYNPAQPYLPQDYGSKSKQSTPNIKPNKAVANLVPPPLPPAPQLTADDFPVPTSYESFPPYPPSAPVSSPVLPPPPPPPPKPPVNVYQPPKDAIPGDTNDNGPPMDLGYRYKPSSSSGFVPTLPPISSSFDSYKPMMTADAPPLGGYSYNKPPMTFDSPPAMDMDMNGYSYDKPPMVMDNNKPEFSGYQYDKPKDHPAPSDSSSYGAHTPPFNHDSDYPELIFDKPHGNKGSDDSKDMGMMPPPPPPQDMKPDIGADSPPDDHGFPHDFPGDFKYHDFDHDLYHHHHHPTTTTTTTEMPRVNRYSYYYLGKKLYYLPLYFSVYFIIYVGALIIKAVLRHKIVYPNSWRPNDQTASFFSKRSVDSWDLSNENLHEITGRVTRAIGQAAEKYMTERNKSK
ncbi:histone-lysine N-methyltransferase SETD1B [Plodia interpunctella]|uniref:histone-lysine N-methyltransferase SETD1B n=1 Tax=Plodia interpunctella TaxID=58824 RepID=UPI002367F79A|nr:histone-lysine N-methyltransferase SETD1B-like [Plodia interpunctella]